MRAAILVTSLAVLTGVVLLAASPAQRTAMSIGTTPVFLASGTSLTSAHEVVGRVSGKSPVGVQLYGLARFSNANSYFCVASGGDELQTLGPQVINVDGAHFRILHAAADPSTVTYRCIGM